MYLEEKLSELGLKLPTASSPGGNYVSVNLRANIAYIAIQFPILNEEFKFQGRLGNEISTHEGVQGMELCALNVLSQVNEKIGFEKVIMKQGKLIGYFINDQQSSFYQSPSFSKVLKFVQTNSAVCKMKEKQTRNGLRLLLTFENIKSVDNALKALQPILA